MLYRGAGLCRVSNPALVVFLYLTGITREYDYRAVTRTSYSPNLGWPDVATRFTEEGGLLGPVCGQVQVPLPT